MKKLLALLLTLSLLLTFAACGGAGGKLTENAVRNHKVSPREDYHYEVSLTGYRITDYYGDDPIFVIPDIIEGYAEMPPSKIGGSVFSYDSTVRGVYCPPSVTEIDATAFMNLDYLEVVICEGAEVIERGAFENCPMLHTVILGDNLKEIQKSAFADCPSLTELYIAPSMTEIAEEDAATIFEGSDNLTIKGQAGSFIESFCAEQEIPFKAV